MAMPSDYDPVWVASQSAAMQIDLAEGRPQVRTRAAGIAAREDGDDAGNRIGAESQDGSTPRISQETQDARLIAQD
jgi:hypothetical protein